jgi:pheromone shutdown protein TraB
MTARALRWWIVLTGCIGALAAGVTGSRLLMGLAGLACIGLALLVVLLDGQRKRGRVRR